jgi:hypothetical protein
MPLSALAFLAFLAQPFYPPCFDSSDPPLGHTGLANSIRRISPALEQWSLRLHENRHLALYDRNLRIRWLLPHTIGARNQCRIPCEWVTATCGAARSAQIATAAAQITANARTRARNLAIHSSDHRLGSQRGAACRARHTFLARYRRVISIDCRKCFFFSHERAGSQPGATSVAVKLQSPAWGRRVQSLSTDGDMAGPPNPSILALEAQAAQSGRSCSEFNRSRPARRVGARHRLIHFFQERTAEQPVLHSFCRLCHLWSGELDRTRKRREFRISCFAEVSFKGIRLSAIAHSTHRADRAGRDSARAFYPTIKRGASQAIL